MTLRSRIALALLVVALVGCDSNGDADNLRRLEGIYTLDTLIFDPATQALPDANVGAQLDLAATRLEIFGDDNEALFRVQFRDGRGSRRINLLIDPASTRASLEAITEDDRDDLADLFLPPEFTLAYEGETPRQLEATISLTGINLEAFDPSTYQDQRSNRGTLTVRFVRP